MSLCDEKNGDEKDGAKKDGGEASALGSVCLFGFRAQLLVPMCIHLCKDNASHKVPNILLIHHSGLADVSSYHHTHLHLWITVTNLNK
jgi:hypothetical protein